MSSARAIPIPVNATFDSGAGEAACSINGAGMKATVTLLVLGDGEPERDDVCVSDAVDVLLEVPNWLEERVGLLETDDICVED